jgi:hypothetical protein
MDSFIEFLANLFIVVGDGKSNKTRNGCLLIILIIFLLSIVGYILVDFLF